MRFSEVDLGSTWPVGHRLVATVNLEFQTELILYFPLMYGAKLFFFCRFFAHAHKRCI